MVEGATRGWPMASRRRWNLCACAHDGAQSNVIEEAEVDEDEEIWPNAFSG